MVAVNAASDAYSPGGGHLHPDGPAAHVSAEPHGGHSNVVNTNSVTPYPLIQ